MEVEAKHPNSKNCKCGITYEKIDELNMLPMKYMMATLDSYNDHFIACIQGLNHWISVPADKLVIITDIMRKLCATGTGLDDIYDSSALRHGIPTTHKIFGIGNTATACTFQLCGIMENLLELNQPKAMEIFWEALRQMTAGEGIELYWRDNYSCPTEEEFDAMAIMKSSTFHLLLAKLMQLFDNQHRDVEKLLTTVGLYAQVANDYYSLTRTEHFASRGFCDDITEGKFSFPICYAINSHPEEKGAIIDILKKRTNDIEEKKQCLAILKKCATFEYTKNKLKKLELVMLKEVTKLGGNPHLPALISSMQKAV